MTTSRRQQALELEAELLRLNALVRKRREQLNRLEKCPNKNCECRAVWREVVEKNLASQMGKISSHVRANSTAKPEPKRKTAKSRARSV